MSGQRKQYSNNKVVSVGGWQPYNHPQAPNCKKVTVCKPKNEEKCEDKPKPKEECRKKPLILRVEKLVLYDDYGCGEVPDCIVPDQDINITWSDAIKPANASQPSQFPFSYIFELPKSKSYHNGTASPNCIKRTDVSFTMDLLQLAYQNAGTVVGASAEVRVKVSIGSKVYYNETTTITNGTPDSNPSVNVSFEANNVNVTDRLTIVGTVVSVSDGGSVSIGDADLDVLVHRYNPYKYRL